MELSHQSDESEQPVDKSNAQVAGVVGKNIAEMARIRGDAERKKGIQERLADVLTLFSGSMIFVYV